MWSFITYFSCTSLRESKTGFLWGLRRRSEEHNRKVPRRIRTGGEDWTDFSNILINWWTFVRTVMKFWTLKNQKFLEQVNNNQIVLITPFTRSHYRETSSIPGNRCVIFLMEKAALGHSCSKHVFQSVSYCFNSFQYSSVAHRGMNNEPLTDRNSKRQRSPHQENKISK
jgi:hypothetical protein